MSDVAYCIVLIENSHEVWEEELEAKKKTARLTLYKQERFTEKCKLPKEEKKRFLKMEPKEPQDHI